MHQGTLEPASFRDPDNRVFYAEDGAVLRALTADGLADWRRLAATDFFRDGVARGTIVATELLEDPPELPEPARFETALRHEAVPFVSYPYEWCFGMLKDAALLQLELVLAALDEQMILKDASPYNVQWRGARPVFIDVGSFESLRAGEPWAGYRQFCMLFLYPLLLQAYRSVSFNPWLRGRLDGLTPQECRDLLSLRDLLRPGVFTHVHLHARLERRYEARDRNVRDELQAAGFRTELIRANAQRLHRLVGRLEWKARRSAWSSYGATTTYDEADAERKAEFVRTAAGTRNWRLLWDLGCNDGRYTRLAAQHARYAVAIDADEAVVERLYLELKKEETRTILPLALNLVDPSPDLGWRGLERRTLSRRGRPDLTLCLALVHHLAIGGNLPLRGVVEWLRSLETALVVEFVAPDDPMAERLLSAKRAGTHPDYDRETFERLLREAFDVDRMEELASGTRVLYFGRPRA